MAVNIKIQNAQEQRRDNADIDKLNNRRLLTALEEFFQIQPLTSEAAPGSLPQQKKLQ